MDFTSPDLAAEMGSGPQDEEVAAFPPPTTNTNTNANTTEFQITDVSIDPLQVPAGIADGTAYNNNDDSNSNKRKAPQRGADKRASYSQFTKVSLVKRFQAYHERPTNNSTAAGAPNTTNVNNATNTTTTTTATTTTSQRKSYTQFIRDFQHPYDLAQVGVESPSQLPPPKTFRKWLSDPVILQSVADNALAGRPLRKRRRSGQFPEIEAALLRYMYETGETSFKRLQEKALTLANDIMGPSSSGGRDGTIVDGEGESGGSSSQLPQHKELDRSLEDDNNREEDDDNDDDDRRMQDGGPRGTHQTSTHSTAPRFAASKGWMQKVLERYRQQTISLPGGVTTQMRGSLARQPLPPIVPRRMHHTPTAAPPTIRRCTTTPITIGRDLLPPTQDEAMDCVIQLTNYAESVDSPDLQNAVAQVSLAMAKIQHERNQVRQRGTKLRQTTPPSKPK